MGQNAKHALGTSISKGGNVVAEITEIGGVDMSADTIDTSTLDIVDGFRTFIQGMKDAGDVSLSGYFYPGDSNGQAALLAAFNSGSLDAYIINFPASMGASWTFNGIVTQFTTGAALEDAVSFECTIKVSGKPNLGLTPSAGLTALALSGGGTLSPTVAAATLGYSYVFTGQTSITATVTAAAHTLKLYVDGQYVQDLTSGAASNAIAGFTAQSSKEITVVAYEAGKTPKVYTIMATRTT